MVNPEKIITNIDLPACRNCIYYTPTTYDSDFTSSLNRCAKFGTKNIITDKITYDFADSCRHDETQCGKNGKYFEKDDNVSLKIFKHKILTNWSYGLVTGMIILFLQFSHFINYDN
jgi:hypothetical protein